MGLISALCLLAVFTPGLAQRPASEVRVELGRRLFYDADLSIDGTMACATEITGKAADNGKFRTSSLRNVAISAPYLHDGSARTLTGAIRRRRMATGLKDGEVEDLAVFLRTLTDDRFVADPRFSLPKTSCEAAAATL